MKDGCVQSQPQEPQSESEQYPLDVDIAQDVITTKPESKIYIYEVIYIYIVLYSYKYIYVAYYFI